MENAERLDKLFFELASESRIEILRELQKENLKMQDIARRLNLTATEAFRQLERLSAALLVQRQPDGTYALTPFGRLELHLSSSMEFALKHKQYFLTHDVWRLPQQFVDRIGELSKATLNMNLVESTRKSSQIIGEAQRYMWGISPEPLPQPFDVISKQIPKGAEYKILSPQPPARFPNLENRTLADYPAVFALTEKEAAFSFRFTDGRPDYAAFFGNDPLFLDWVKDLFLHYWEKGKRT
ncbi:MAG: helix-turn-helix transcriptional regulator [Candidatus Bathyarchaeia archaeon]